MHELLTGEVETFKQHLAVMAVSPHPKVREVGAEMLGRLDVEETHNILSNMIKGTDIWSLGCPTSIVSCGSDFSLEAFYSRSQTLYVIVPEDKLTTYNGFLRVMIGLALSAMARAGREQAPPAERPLFLLDEAAALGHLEPLEKGMGYIRAYARAMLIFQDLDQLKRTYTLHQSIIANAGCVAAWAVNDNETAQMLAERIGKTTVATRSSGVGQASAHLMQHYAQAGTSESGRYLIDPAEIMRLPSDELLLFDGRGVGWPIRAKRVRYYEEARFAGMFDAWRSGGEGREAGSRLERLDGGAAPGMIAHGAVSR